MNARKAEPEGACFFCESYGSAGMVQPIEGLEEHLECLDEPACELRIRSRNDLIGAIKRQCSICKQPVYMANSSEGYRIAIEPEPHPGGLYVIESIDQGEIYITRFRSKSRPPDRALYRLHASRCAGQA